ncbi:MAG: GNAT family N-acetyltransferase [Planctomycetota bacterium]|nr:GNAT family N-acetyltransferase [Planctomycetota bacterium]
MNLRPFTDADFDKLVSAWRAASVVAHPFLTPDFLEAEVESIRDYLPAAETWVAEDDGKLVGFLSLLGSEVGALFVHPAAWHKGIGRALLAKAVELRGDLTLRVFAENEVGRTFYRKMGFLETGRESHKQTGNELVRMELSQGSSTEERTNDASEPERKDG